jgi:hypothetical protein
LRGDDREERFKLDPQAFFVNNGRTTKVPTPMNASPLPSPERQIYWPSVITVLSAAILIGAEVFGAAFAGGWAIAILLGFEDTGAHIIQGLLFVLGVAIMVAFIRGAQRIEPFKR